MCSRILHGLIALGLAAVVLVAAAQPASGQADHILASPPATPDLSATYVFYLHGQIIETGGRRPTHPQFGVYEYDGILGQLAGADRYVISEQRASNTDVSRYADTIVRQVEGLLHSGVPPAQVAVVGFSKGGKIAIAVSSRLAEPITYAFLAACNTDVFDDESARAHGRVLSIYEASDEIGISCAPLLARSPEVVESKEVRIATGAMHGTFYRPRSEWVPEVLHWVEHAGG